MNRMSGYANNAGNSGSYKYDFTGIRTQKVSGGATTNYYSDESGRVLAESDATGALKAQNVLGAKPLARIIGGKWYYYLYNQHGDVVRMVDDTGAVVNSYAYDEWGNLLSKSETVANPIRYAGEYQDDESGYYYLRARYYDPVYSRFVSRDTNEGKVTNPLTLNLYAYCNENPVMGVDPSGNQAVQVMPGGASSPNNSGPSNPYELYLKMALETYDMASQAPETPSRDVRLDNWGYGGSNNGTAKDGVQWSYKINGDSLTIFEGTNPHSFTKSKKCDPDFYFAVRNWNKNEGYVNALFPVDYDTAVEILKLGFRGYSEGVVTQYPKNALNAAKDAGNTSPRSDRNTDKKELPHYHPRSGSAEASTHSWFDEWKIDIP